MDSSRDESTLFQISRESSVGQSSRIYYYRRAEGVPFQWERQPGTPKNPPKLEDVNINTPLSPPPSFQSLGLTKPCFDDHREPQQSKRFKVWLSKKIKKLHPLKTFGKSHQNSHDIGVLTSFNNSTSSSFSTDSFASNTKEREKSARGLIDDDPYCCNLTTTEDKEETKLAYRKMHKRAFSEESGETFFLNRIDLSRMSSLDQSSHSYYRSTEGIPFEWEKQPGTPIHTPQCEVIPPPSPPPMVQSLALPKPCIPHDQEEDKKATSTWERIKRMIKSTDQQKDEFKISDKLSFRIQQSNHHGHNSVLSSSSSSSSSISKKRVLPFSKFRRDALGRKFCFKEN